MFIIQRLQESSNWKHQ